MQFGRLFSSRKRGFRKIARALHADIKKQALHSQIYLAGIAEDSLNGRFEQVALHSAMVMRHLRNQGDDGRLVSQLLYEDIFSGFDYSLRETGVGDTSISRKVRKLGEHFFGLARGLDAAFADDEENALLDFANRNGLGHKDVSRLVAYLLKVDDALHAQSSKITSQFGIDWPEISD